MTLFPYRITVFALWLCFAPIQGAAQDTGYVGSESCIDCHTEAAQSWMGSHHAKAWTDATEANIAADFGDTEFALRGLRARFFRDDAGAHVVSVTEPDGNTRDYPVHSVIGVEPLQQYILETEPGRLQTFDVVWDTERREWFHLYPSSDLSPRDGLHWTGPYKTWNARCASCHATGFEKNYDLRSRNYASTQVERGVGCEACHGPGADHLAWLEGGSQTAPPPLYGFTVDFTDRDQTLELCATCHSRREAHVDGNPVPGTGYHDAYNLALLREGLYHADGQILEEVFVYGSFLQSKMHARGVGCLDCHDAHNARRVADGNAVCSQCHSPAANPRFPTLTPGEYDSPAHHFHPADGPGGQCKNCHMVEQVYMGNDWRADHSFRVPRPDLSAETGAPDACTTCHTDRTASWAAAQLQDWYPQSRHRGPHYGSVLARGRADPVAASEDLIALALSPDMPSIVRATALALVERAESFTAADDLARLLENPDPLIRAAAAGVQRAAPVEARVSRLLPLLGDPTLNVRIASVRSLLDIPPTALPAEGAAPYKQALRDWQGALSTRLDFPETHLQLAGVGLTRREFDTALRAFRMVVTQDPQRVEAWVMIVRINAALGADVETLRALLSEALAANPANPDLGALAAQLPGGASPSLVLPPR